MNKIRVVFGSEDGERISRSHLGDSPVFYIYDIYGNGEVKFVEKRSNSVRDMEHAGLSKLEEISKILRGTDVVVAVQNSPNLKKMVDKTDFQPVMINTLEVKEAVALLSREFEKIFTVIGEKRMEKSKKEILYI